jgi:hypothetical protein
MTLRQIDFKVEAADAWLAQNVHWLLWPLTRGPLLVGYFVTAFVFFFLPLKYRG